jgi:hypothetical protein
MAKSLLVLAFLFSLTQIQATEVNLNLFPNGGDTKVDVVNVVYDELDIFVLQMPIEKRGGRDLKLLCSFNPFYETQKSVLVLSHDNMYRGVRFFMDDQSCLKLFSFLKANYEVVNKDNPIQITFNLDKMEVETIGWKNESLGQKAPKVTLFH